MPVSVTCSRCGVGYDPAPVGGACPVCRTPAHGGPVVDRRPADNALLLVGVATIANLVLLAVLTVLLYR